MTTFTLLHRIRLLRQVSIEKLPPLVSIIAPPGYGKTVLGHQLVDHLRLPTAWHRLNRWQQDIPILHKQSIQALQSIIDIPYENVKDWRSSALTISSYLGAFKQPLLYVLDDVHHANDSLDVGKWLQVLIETLPANTHLILIGRSVPPAPWTEFIAYGNVITYNTHDLLMTAEDVQALSSFSETASQAIVDQFKGWPAGIRAALSGVDYERIKASYAQADGDQLFDDFARQIFLAQPSDTQRFLLGTSTLTEFSREHCIALGLPIFDPHIALILHQNLFVEKTTAGYVYHDLFRSFLQTYLKDHDPQLFIDLHQRAAQWYETRDNLGEAVMHYAIIESFDEAARITESVAKEFFIFGRWQTLLSFLDQLTDCNVPRLNLFCGLIYTERSQLDLAFDQLMLAQRGYSQRGDPVNLARANLQLALLHIRIGASEDALNLADQALEIPTLPLDLIGWLERTRGYAYISLSRFQEAVIHLKQALDLFQQDQSFSHAQNQVLLDLSDAYLRMGDFDRAGEVLQDVVARNRREGNDNDLAFSLNNLGYYYHCCSQYQDSLETFQKGIDVITDQFSRTNGLLHWSLADLYRDLGNYQEAERHYLVALDIMRDADLTTYAFVLVSFARMRIWQRRYGDAISFLENVHANVAPHLEASHLADVMISCIRLLNPESLLDSKELIQKVVEFTPKASPLRIAQIASLYLHIGFLHENELVIQHALSLIQNLSPNLHQPLAAEMIHLGIRSYMETYRNSKRYNHLFAAIDALLEHYKDPIQSTLLIADRPQLIIKTLGTTSIMLNGSEISWIITKARDLFLYLYFMGAKPKAAIVLEFWPEHSLQRGNSIFRDTLKRVRKSIDEGIIHSDGLYQVNPQFQIECDVHQFESYLQRARRLPRTNARTEDLYLRALALYRGDFLSDLMTDWADDTRRRLQDLYTEDLIGCASCAEAREDYQSAIELYQRAINLDPYADELCEAVMKCYGHQGKKQAIISFYQRYYDLLQEDLGIEPSPHLQMIRDTLLGS